MDEQVELAAEGLAGLGEDALHVLVRAHVARGHQRAVDARSQVPNGRLDPLALVRER